MSITIYTSNPRQLHNLIREHIENGDIKTWEVDSDGDYTHMPDQWHKVGWIHPTQVIEDDRLIYGFIGRNKIPTTKTEYAIYHGRFAEMILTHFDTKVSKIEISSLPTRYDNIYEE